MLIKVKEGVGGDELLERLLYLTVQLSLTLYCLVAVFVFPSIYCIDLSGKPLIVLNGKQSEEVLKLKLNEAFLVCKRLFVVVVLVMVCQLMYVQYVLCEVGMYAVDNSNSPVLLSRHSSLHFACIDKICTVLCMLLHVCVCRS